MGLECFSEQCSKLLGVGLGKFGLDALVGMGLEYFLLGVGLIVLLGVGLIVLGRCSIETDRRGTNKSLATKLG